MRQAYFYLSIAGGLLLGYNVFSRSGSESLNADRGVDNGAGTSLSIWGFGGDIENDGVWMRCAPTVRPNSHLTGRI